MISRSSRPAVSRPSSASRGSLHLVILASREGWHTRDLTRALAARGHTGAIVPYEALVARLGTGRGVVPALSIANNEILDADAVLARIIPSGSLEQMIYRVDALHWIERRGVPVMNSPRAIERSVDKFYTTALLQEARLPTPETVVCEGATEAMTLSAGAKCTPENMPTNSKPLTKSTSR